MEYTLVTLSSGITAKLKPYLTGREKRKLRAVFLKDVQMSTGEDGKPVTTGLKGSVVDEGENAAIECVVVELEGRDDDILNRVLDLKSHEYDELMVKINDVTSDKRFLEK